MYFDFFFGILRLFETSHIAIDRACFALQNCLYGSSLESQYEPKKSKYCVFDIKFLSHFLSFLAKYLSLQRLPKNQLDQNVARSILRQTVYRALSKNVLGPSSISHKMTKSRLILIYPSTALVHFDFYTS